MCSVHKPGGASLFPFGSAGANAGPGAATSSLVRDVVSDAWIDLYWLPLGAGGHCVRWNGRLYERLVAATEHRQPCELFHSALQIRRGNGTTYAVEMGPVWNVTAADRGVVCEGPVGARRLGRLRAFRYEVRCWPDGYIPDIEEAVGTARVSADPCKVAAVLQVLPQVPPLIWGRDELGSGDMWNSNSLVSWALARTGHDMRMIRPPQHGRAPGWRAGLVLAERQGTVLGRSCQTGNLT